MIFSSFPDFMADEIKKAPKRKKFPGAFQIKSFWKIHFIKILQKFKDRLLYSSLI